MRIKIIKNDPLGDKIFRLQCSDISHLIGREFEVMDSHDDGVFITIGGKNKLLFHGEYEIVEE